MCLAYTCWYANLNMVKSVLPGNPVKINLSNKNSFSMEKKDKEKRTFKKNSEKASFSIFIAASLFANIKPINETSYSNKNLVLSSIVIDGNSLNLKREDVFNENFLFSPLTTKSSEVEMEIEEIEDDEYRYSAWKNTQIGLAVGGSALGMWFAYNGLNAWERWMKEQEKKDIEEEIQMTGTYINPGAGNVEASIDPITGKKIQIKSPSKEDSEEKKNPENKSPEKKE
mmetsp:Transcript_37929/g.89415  ORF Transcript_37929/g.89415 Transcript_37929/m.89415 type:complete len:227 (+) Transcript_37929:33-713(+)